MGEGEARLVSEWWVDWVGRLTRIRLWGEAHLGLTFRRIYCNSLITAWFWSEVDRAELGSPRMLVVISVNGETSSVTENGPKIEMRIKFPRRNIKRHWLSYYGGS